MIIFMSAITLKPPSPIERIRTIAIPKKGKEVTVDSTLNQEGAEVSEKGRRGNSFDHRLIDTEFNSSRVKKRFTIQCPYSINQDESFYYVEKLIFW